ncbi:MAG: alpha/beta hydrolase, partial [Acidimicrobiaceae bacterium]|nr:alpha/beta hydrolase [Acidimicrobiaceae bacterium]
MAINLEDHLDADHLAVLEMLPGDLLDLSDLDEARIRWAGFMAQGPVPEIDDSIEITDHHTPAGDGHQVLVRVYRRKDRRDDRGGLYSIHGGGMVLGDVSMNDARCAAIALNLDVVVASVDYRLAPEHPYPAPLEDCYCGLVWFFDQAGAFGVDTARIAVGGGSAGGGLAAGLALLARDRGQVSPCFQLLTFPMIDDRNQTPSSHMVDDTRLWNRAANIAGWSAYLDGRNGAEDVPVY